jgi:8-oxo-dGTP diphosphatase
MPYTYAYPRPSVTVDCVVFGLDGLELEDLKVLLIERGREPFAGCWALPGGFVDMGEDLETAARRELEEETGVTIGYLEQLYTFGAPQRDPRGRVISVAWYGLVRTLDHTPTGADDANEAAWFPVVSPPPLAFDHQQVLTMAHERLKAKIRYAPVGFNLLPEQFTLRQLQRLYEVLLDRPLDKRNFRRKLLSMGLLIETNELQQDVPHRAARLYRFDPQQYQELTRQGFVFDL